MRIGFITALGTPKDENDRFLPNSYAAQVKDQIAHGASGLLSMGSMGLGVYVRDRDYALVAQTVVEAAGGKAPVYIGVTDTCVSRCRDRIDAVKHLAAQGLVATAPYYYAAAAEEHMAFYTALAEASPLPLYLYDLPGVSKSKISLATAVKLAAHPNIRGMKTADLALCIDLLAQQEAGEIKGEFQVFYSGLDTFAAAARLGLPLHLDGMLACTASLTQQAFAAFGRDDFAAGYRLMGRIIALRDVFAEGAIFPAFSYAMNLLGFPGNHAPDYQQQPGEAQKDRIRARMGEIGLL